ncbi:nucleoside kinase [Dethiobacter alkaliphilus]|nr:nucleoside kinase [Dethiobacter alkaliphilus]MCW3489387.1 nucleoside kinase [Dethiobacter alkaliphilus]
MTNGKKELTVDILLPDNEIIELPGNRSLLEIRRDVAEHFPSTIVAALVDEKVRDLETVVDTPSVIKFLDLYTKEGARIYQRSLTFLLLYATHVLFPKAEVKVEHSLGKGLYCEIDKSPKLTADDVSAIEQKMWEVVNHDLPIAKTKVPVDKAIEIFRKEGFEDKVRLYKRWPKETLTLYGINGFQDSLHGYMVPSTGVLQLFSLEYYEPGVILRFPDEKDPFSIPRFVEQNKLFDIFRESERWARILGVSTVGVLNDVIEEGEGADIIRINEALHEKKIAQIADMITEREDEICVILIAGPSSSGKTTFAQRLRTQLLVNGIRPFPISLDDYFVDRDNTPLDESNKPDFEHIEAIDLDLFNKHLIDLINGGEVEIPTFNFSTGTREYNGKRIKLEKNQPLIIEGIHGLNERLTQSIPRNRKFKIYVSALTALNVDQHTRIHTTDTRLLRRIVRDNQFRGTDALTTIRRWPSVRRGEDRNIFHLQEEADIMFNSALVYELAILKQHAEPLLEKIEQTEPEYVDAKRLRLFLSGFVPLDSHDVPSNSILREFIGESCFFRI